MAMMKEEERRLLEQESRHQSGAQLEEERPLAKPPLSQGKMGFQRVSEKDATSRLLSFWVDGQGTVEDEEERRQREERRSGLREPKREGGSGGHLEDEVRRPGVTSDFEPDTKIAAGERAKPGKGHNPENRSVPTPPKTEGDAG